VYFSKNDWTILRFSVNTVKSFHLALYLADTGISHGFDGERARLDLEDEEAVEVGMERVVSAAHEAVGAVEEGRWPVFQFLLMASPEVVVK